MDQGEASPNARTGNTTTNAVPNNVTLRIVILAHGSGREDDLYLVLGLDTTLGELKSRIQESLPQHPSPEHQRIIYQGRGLDNTNEPLRSILRHEQRADTSSYVLHLVIRQGPGGSQPPTAAAAAAAAEPLPATGPHHAPSNTAQHSRQTQVQAPRVQPAQVSPHENHMRIHNQVHLMQHAMQHQSALNRAQLAQRFQATPPLPRPDQMRQITQGLPTGALNTQPQPASQVHAPLPAAPGQGQMPDHNTSNVHMPTVPSVHQPGMTLPNAQLPHAPNLHPAQAGSPPVHHPMTSTTQVRTAVDSNGQQTRTIVNGGPTGTTTMTFRITGLNPPNPLDRPSSAPGSSPSADADPANRTINPVPGNIQIHAQRPPMPMGFPFPQGMQLPFPIANMIPNLVNPFQQMPHGNPSSQPMAWLLSSPTGPQGIVFAPGHGFFNTSSMITNVPSQLQPTLTVPHAAATATPLPQQAQLVVRPPTETTSPAPPQPGARPQPPAAGVLLPPAAPPRAAVRARAGADNNQNDMLQFIINRGWLFLRLYMFVFVFSESGTWRRILLIGAIIIYCCLPQQNPLTNGVQAVRRHFDNLIGPPAIAQRQPQRPQPGHGNTAQRTVNQTAEDQAASTNSARQRAAPMPTPEETARRLLERQNRRNPNPIIDALRRFEQGVVLFLASLVPGVGERHVRAREEARRIVQEEEQRRINEAQQETPSGAEQSDSGPEARTAGTGEGPLPETWKANVQPQEQTNVEQATSSGVDRTGQEESAGVRSRNTNTED